MSGSPTVNSAPFRPNGSDAGSELEARAAATDLVAELQEGWDEHDADVTDRHFANDIIWGSPFGATLRGYERLHQIHVELKAQRQGGSRSRFELVDLIALAPDVAVAQIRRVALPTTDPTEHSDDTDDRSFSESALYVMVKRAGTWWVAAGHNTPIQ